MRKLVGVNEDVLDWVPEERPRYTRLGFIVFNTGLLAGVSMHMALRIVTDAPWWLLLPADFFWITVIMTADSWLISSTHGAPRSSRIGMYVPRLLLSVLLGLVIAEPLVLAVFNQTISNEIGEHRKGEIDNYESTLKRCNPPSGELLSGESCNGFLVTVTERPASVEAELTQATTNRDALKVKVEQVGAVLADLERLARDECAGRVGAGLTGVPGEGPECSRNRVKADEFRRDSQIERLHLDLVAADQLVVNLTTKLAEARIATEREVGQGIRAKVEEKRNNLTERGLLDEFDALGRLSGQSFAVGTAHFLLALLLIVLDCLPVLSKLMSNNTAYDDRVRNQLTVSNRLHDRQLRTSERRDTVDLEIQEARLEQRLRAKIEDIGGEDRSAKERRRIELSEQIDRLASVLEQER